MLFRSRQLFLKYGVGFGSSAKERAVEVKTASIGKQRQFFIFIDQWEVGGWFEQSNDPSRKSSGFIDYSVGLNVDAGYLYVQSLWGVAAITTKDSYLGGNFQFNQDFSLGVKDARGVAIGLNYKHMSSAGIFTPNVGRDFISIRLGVPLGP